MKKKDSFEGQKMIVLPEKIIKVLRLNTITKNIHLTDIGYFPHAKDHFRRREKGSLQYILLYCVGGSGWISINGKKSAIYKNSLAAYEIRNK